MLKRTALSLSVSRLLSRQATASSPSRLASRQASFPGTPGRNRTQVVPDGPQPPMSPPASPPAAVSTRCVDSDAGGGSKARQVASDQLRRHLRKAHTLPALIGTCKRRAAGDTAGGNALNACRIAEEARPASDSLAKWKRARTAVNSELAVKRLHRDVDRVWKRICKACLFNHSLCAGILYRGVAGYTRAQTVRAR